MLALYLSMLSIFLCFCCLILGLLSLRRKIVIFKGYIVKILFDTIHVSTFFVPCLITIIYGFNLILFLFHTAALILIILLLLFFNKSLPRFYLINVNKEELRIFIEQIFEKREIKYEKKKKTIHIPSLTSRFVLNIEVIFQTAAIFLYPRKNKTINAILYEDLKKMYHNKRSTKRPFNSLIFFILCGLLLIPAIYFSMNIITYPYLC